MLLHLYKLNQKSTLIFIEWNAMADFSSYNKGEVYKLNGFMTLK